MSDEKKSLKERKEFCKKNGHNFEDWIPVTYQMWVEDGPSGIEALFTGTGYKQIERTKWVRRCNCCGYTQVRLTKPQEVIDIEQEILRLQRKIGK